MAINLSVGASVAWAGHFGQPDERWWRSSALWALVTLELMVIAPMSAFILHRYPAWSLLYVAEGSPLTPWLEVGGAVSGLGVALGGFVAVRMLLGRHKRMLAMALVPAGLLIAGAILFAASQPLSLVGNRAAYIANTTRLRPFAATSLMYLVCGAGTAFLVAWGATLWRLFLVGRAGGKSRPPSRRTVQDHPGTVPLPTPGKRGNRGT